MRTLRHYTLGITMNMRALVFSDIHDNIGHVRLLREREKNEYDFLIVAGDIGDKITAEFLEVVNTFDCPVYFVYGNWDGKSPYDVSLPKNCFLLNQNIERCGDLYIAGFSGCPTHWGKNPIYQSLCASVREKHADIFGRFSEVSQIRSEATRKLKEEVELAMRELAVTYPERGNKYESALAKLEKKKEKALDTLYKPLAKVKRAAAFTKFQKDMDEVRQKVQKENRRALFHLIQESGVPQRKLILVTHERLTCLADDGLFPLMHVFGHIHEHKLTDYKGTWYLNAAALDNGASEMFGREVLHPEGYCTVDFSNEAISVGRHLLHA